MLNAQTRTRPGGTLGDERLGRSVILRK